MTRFRWFVPLAVGLVLGATACGGDELAPGMTEELDAAYELVVAAVQDGDRSEALRALRSLTDVVEAGERAGTIDPNRAHEILAAADGVLVDLRLLPAPVATSPSASSTVEPSPSDGAEDEGSEEHGQGEAKGHDKENNGEGNGNGEG